jgi:AcrR family transcriptional regulator
MGLREKKAKRSREIIVARALELFAADGYEGTTMEAIAEAADVSPSTLYRYYPTKDSIVLASFTANTRKFAEIFAASVKELPVERALGEAIFAVLAVEDSDPERALFVRSLLGQSLTMRARLWDYLGEQQKQLASLLAEAMHADASDLRVTLAARVALDLVLSSADIWRASEGAVSSRHTATQLMTLLRSGQIPFPDPGASETHFPSPSCSLAKTTKATSRKKPAR